MIPPGLHPDWRDVEAAGPWSWPHFSPRELACRCGRDCAGEYFHDPDFLDALEALRLRMGRALKINSGRRCPVHNAKVGGAAMSRHKLAIAADISLGGHLAEALAIEAAQLFTGLGFGRTFLHVDHRPRRAGFHYPGGKLAWTNRFGFDPAVRFAMTGSLRGENP